MNVQLTAQELLNELEDNFSLELLVVDDYNSEWRQMTYTIALFVFMYTLDNNGQERERIITSNKEKTSTLQTKHLDPKTFGEALSWYYEKRCQGVIPLRHLIKKIELEQGLMLQY